MRKSLMLLAVMMLFMLNLAAQDTITLDAVNVSADRLKTQTLNPLMMKKVDTLVLQAK